MTQAPSGRPRAIGAALFACAVAGGAAQADGLAVIARDGTTLARIEGREICLRWQHSVTGGDVADCFDTTGGVLVLRRSFLHDFAAGLGHIPGRGVQHAAPGGGYWIDGIDEAVPGNALVLRVGAPGVAHRLVADGAEVRLGDIAPRQRVTLRPLPSVATATKVDR